MKKVIINSFTFIGLFLSIYANAADFASLAVDRSNGFVYGWSHDQPSLNVAERSALRECNKRSNNNGCSIVLAWSGGGCGAYRTIDSQLGTAYGWAIAPTRNIADALANKNALERSNGIAAPNYVWACNTSKKDQLKLIKPKS